MGIQGLLPFLKKATRPTNVKEFKGGVVAVDTYCWLHKGAFACAEKLALGEKTDQYVLYCMKYVNILLSFDIKPIMVFDGCRLPSKREVEKARRERRNANRKKAAKLLMEGKKSEARDCLVQCIDVTPEMALDLMNACRERGVDCIVAPYEADAQLAYLNKIGIVDVVITEDSDLTLFGCDKILFKMDINGNGQLVERSKIPLAIDLPEDQFTFEKFRRICILSGCDYLASLPGIGLAKATKVFKLSKQTDVKQLIRRIPMLLKMPSLSVPEEYVENFIRAENTFLYQLVYDPLQRKVAPLNPYPPSIDASDLRYAGPPLSEEMGFQIAIGNININTGEMMANFDPDTFRPKTSDFNKNVGEILSKSIWNVNSKKFLGGKKRNLGDEQMMMSPAEEMERPNTKGKETTIMIQNRGNVNILKKKSELINDDSIIPGEELAKMYSAGKQESEDVEDESEIIIVDRAKLSNDTKNVTPLSPERPQNVGGEVKRNQTTPFTSPSKRNLFAVQKSEEKTRFSLDGCPGTPKSEKNKCRFFVPSPEPVKESKFFVQLKQVDAECERADDNVVDVDNVEVKSNGFGKPKEGSEFKSRLSVFASRYKRSDDLISKSATKVTHKGSKRNLFSLDDEVDLTNSAGELEAASAPKKLKLDALFDRSDMNNDNFELKNQIKGIRKSIFGVSRANECAANKVDRPIKASDSESSPQNPCFSTRKRVQYEPEDPLCDVTVKELNCSNKPSYHIIRKLSPSKDFASSELDEDPLGQPTSCSTNRKARPKKSFSSLDDDFFEDAKVLSEDGESEDPLRGLVEGKIKIKERENSASKGSRPSGLARGRGRPKKQTQEDSSLKQSSLSNFFTSNFALNKSVEKFPPK